MQMELLRLSLLQREQMDAFEPHLPDGAMYSREQWLRYLFSRHFLFIHRGTSMHFVPADTSLDESIIAGRIGRSLTLRENEPPEAELREIEREAWLAALVLIDPRTHPDGQKVSMEYDNRVGQPLPIFQSLGRHFAEVYPAAPYALEVSGIAESETFWNFVDENDGEITSITFDMIAPNMFGQRDELYRELRELRDIEKARRTQIKIMNEDGLEVQTERMRQAVGYTMDGGGSIRARARSRRTYNSASKIRRILIEEEIDNGEAVSLIQRLRRPIKVVFGDE